MLFKSNKLKLIWIYEYFSNNSIPSKCVTLLLLAYYSSLEEYTE